MAALQLHLVTQQAELFSAAKPTLAQLSPQNVLQLPTDQQDADWLETWGTQVALLVDPAYRASLNEKLDQGYSELVLKIAESLSGLPAVKDHPIVQRVAQLNKMLLESTPFLETPIQLALQPSPLYQTLLSIEEIGQNGVF